MRISKNRIRKILIASVFHSAYNQSRTTHTQSNTMKLAQALLYSMALHARVVTLVALLKEMQLALTALKRAFVITTTQCYSVRERSHKRDTLHTSHLT